MYIECALIVHVCVVYNYGVMCVCVKALRVCMYVHYTVYVCCTCLYVCTRVCKVVSKLFLSSADLET